ncbi:tetratricopeptide repeat protein [Fodinibius halophilus]|uniref:Regulator of microtubule dynamics protein 1 n=1 Tax=Fodinibius halophilus TaxID=1736908 RepID=A0A6M1T7A1_9BACT|nr:hypothetical protein [Fodinibius halophilus]NGP87024.1 hypothetical protein [Fodinibius halophilus]
MRKLILTTSLLLIVPALIVAQQPDSSLISKADSLYDSFVEEKGMDAYLKILEQDPDNYKALWRASFLYSRVGNRFDKESEQKEYFNKAISLAERALKVDSTDSQSNFVMSVAKGRKALISGAKARVAASRDIKKYVDRALKYDKNHAGAWHVLGRWHFKVANLSWIERVAANTLFGGIPGDASNEKAADAIEKAISLNKDYVLYYVDLAKVYEEMGREQKAIEYCQTALEKPSITPDDPNLKNECKEIIDDLR